MFDGKLETFIKVAECGSFTKAAEDLYITPTAVMKQINALEKDLSVTLFDRSNHGLRITKFGEAFLQDARYILEYISRAEQKAREIFEGENRKSIRIGTSVMTPAKFILDVWSQIQIRMATLKIELIPFENNPVNSVEILRNLGQHIDVVAGLYDENFLKERQYPLLKLIPPDWDDSIPFGVFYSPTPTKLVKKFVDLLSSIAAK